MAGVQQCSPKSALSMGEWSVFLQPIKVRSASEGEPCLYIPGLAVFQNASKQTNKQEGETCYPVGGKETMFLHVVTDLVTQAPRDSRCCLRNWEHADYVSGYTSIVRPWMLAYEMETTVRTSTMPSKHWCRMRRRKGGQRSLIHISLNVSSSLQYCHSSVSVGDWDRTPCSYRTQRGSYALCEVCREFA